MENNSNYLVGFGVSPEELSIYFEENDFFELEAIYGSITEKFESIQQDLRSYAQTGDQTFYLDVVAQLRILENIRLRLRLVDDRRE
jgi:hypothetical protein